MIQEPFDFLLPQSNWSCPTEMPELEGAISIDTETVDKYIKKYGPGYCISAADRGHIIGVSVADSAGFSAYYPVRHSGGGNLDPSIVFRWLKEQVKKPRPMVFANAQYDLGWLETEGVVIDPTWVHDVQIQAPLIDENRLSYSLDNLGKDFLGDKKKQDLLYDAARAYGIKDIKAQMDKLPAPFVGPYGEYDAVLTLRLWNHFNEIIDKQELKPIYELERALIPCLFEMRKNGVRVDVDGAVQLNKRLKGLEKQAIKRVKDLTSVNIDPWVAQSCADALEYEGITCGKTEKTNAPSVTQEFLTEKAEAGSVVAKSILQARRYQKAHSTFVQNYVLDQHYNGRLHCSFHALRSDDGGTVSGRFSSSDPNLQNIPARDPELGPLCRSLYLPEEGELWAAEDYSSQEPRLTVHFANIAKLNGGDEAAERYNTDPNTDYHQFTAELCGIPRKEAKIINLGLAYGMGEAKLCRELGIPTEMIEIDDRKNPGQKRMLEVAGPEGKALLEKYHNKMPFMKGLNEMCTRRANIKGYIKTLLGRRCRFPKKDVKGVTIPEGKPGGTRWFTYKAMNRLIQGSAADQMKAAMLAAYKEGKVPLVTVHDEIGLSVKDEKEARYWAEVMENSSKITVPNKVDVEIGINWGDSMK